MGREALVARLFDQGVGLVIVDTLASLSYVRRIITGSNINVSGGYLI